MESYLREVIEEPRYSQALDKLRRKFPILDEMHTDLTWELSHDPTAGSPIAVAPDFWLYTTPAYTDAPACHVLYTFDENKVYLQSIHAV